MYYDTEANLICWEIARGQITNTVEFGDFLIHLSASGKPILIEILDASKFVGKFDKLKNIKDIKQLLTAI